MGVFRLEISVESDFRQVLSNVDLEAYPKGFIYAASLRSLHEIAKAEHVKARDRLALTKESYLCTGLCRVSESCK